MKNKTVIVTGGAGFIGTNLVEKLVNDNEVIVIDNLHTGSNQNLKEFESENLKVINDDAKSISRLDVDADTVFHLGFYSASPMYRDNPMLVSEVVAGMTAVLEYAKEHGSGVVFSSTSSIYNGVKPPHREDIIPDVTDLYTEGRIASERLGLLYQKLHGVNVSAMRFFSVYGYHELSKGGYANLATQFLWAMKKDQAPVIYGDGEQRRDFIFAGDVADALVKAADVKGFEIFNVGYGKNYSLNELVEKLNRMLGKHIKPEYIPMPVKNYVMETLADTTKMKNKLGFTPKVSLDQGLELINRYYK
ncbi:MAG: NAD-dependent epimerase/dehydratase family protein [Candidatus Thermoplasmatota archaeon]|jgi:UDP-glucose 4-epimerase|nr:NAD-dependent epimerase/dehydratase family protein [Candidatus Thermoplasmatota archaeon]